MRQIILAALILIGAGPAIAATVTYQQTFDTEDYRDGEQYSIGPAGGKIETVSVYRYYAIGWMSVERGLPHFDAALGDLNFADVSYSFALHFDLPEADVASYGMSVVSTLCGSCGLYSSSSVYLNDYGVTDVQQAGSYRMSGEGAVDRLTGGIIPLFMAFEGRAQYEKACDDSVGSACTPVSSTRGIVSVSLTYDYTPTMAPVPLPASGALVLGGLGALALFRRRRA